MTLTQSPADEQATTRTTLTHARLADAERLRALAATGIMDSPPEEAYDRLTRLAAYLLESPVALVSLVDTERQFFKSCVGLPEPWRSRRGTPLSHSFCQHVVIAHEPLVVEDAREHAFLKNNGAVVDLGVVAYLGVPLVTSEGQVLGAFCAIDTRPRRWTERDLRILSDLAIPIVTEIETRARVEAVVRETRRRELAERRLRVEHAATLALNQATSAQEGMGHVLLGLREAFGCEWAALWLADPQAQVLRCVDVRAASDWQSAAFEAASRGIALERGTGLPGRAWASGEPVWITDVQNDANFPRIAAAREAGLHSAFCLPVPCDGEIIAVAEFVTRSIEPPDQALLETLQSIGRQLGQFIERKRTEDEVRRQQARTAAIVETALDCIVAMDASGRVTEWNPAAERTFGWTREEAIGRDMAELIIPPDLRERHRAGLARYLATGEGPIFGKRLELTAVRKNGSIVPVELTVTRVPTSGPPAFTGFVRDISERRAAHEQLERNRSLFTSIAETTPDVLTVFDVRESKVVYANREIATALGYSPEEVLAFGSQVIERVIHPDDMAHVQAVIGGFDQLRDGEVSEYEIRACHKDGSWRWLLGRTVVFTRLPDGRPHQVLTLTQDITRRKADAERLRESEERLRLGLAAGNTGTWDWDITNDRVSWSERVFHFHGIAPETFNGRLEDFANCVHPDDLERVTAAVRASHEHDAPYELEYRVVHPDGTVRWLTATGKVYRDDGGRPVRMLGAVSDITERKRAEQERDALLESERNARAEAQRANHLKDEFLATVSHELRTPLNAILGYAQVLRHRGVSGDLATGLEVIERNARVQAEIINDLLDMSRLISGKLRLDVQPVHLPAVIDAAIETVRAAAEAKSIRIIRTLDPGAGPVSGDPSRLQQVVWNLLTNAVKFTPKGGRIQVVLSRVSSHVEITVSDTGQGIRPEFLPHVFDKFRQSDASAARRHGGLGLGLALVKSLVEMHGGSVRASSAGPGAGATFAIELPLSPVRIESAPHERRHPTSWGSPSESALAEFAPLPLDGVLVLAVDDEPDSRDLIRRILEEHGAKVLTAASAPEALEVLERERVDLLLSDIGMPGMDGYELVRRVRALPPERGGDIPAAALTAFARSEDRTRALIAGYQTHISKPVEAVELAAAVASLSRRRLPVEPTS